MTEFNIRKARRGFSLSQGNETLVSEARLIILDKIEENYQNQAPYFKDSTNVTFLLPNLAKYHCKFRAYLEKDLIEQSALLHLEQSDRLNWWCDNECMQRLWPLATTGDGNCLLHAASLAMWGFHDRHLTLRHAVHHRLIHDNFAFHRRWLYQSLADHKSQGFTLSEDEFNEEWSEICNLSFPSPKGSHKPIDISLNNEENEHYLECCRKGNLISRYTSEQNNNNSYSSINSSQCSKSSLSQVSITPKESFYDFLEQIHVFVLAQVIRRPIIVISDTYVRDADGQPIQPLSFGGLYLPLLEKPELCEKSPILLTYSNSHFSALVPMDLNDGSDLCTSHKLPLAVPLIDPVNFELFPLHFSTDPGIDWKTMRWDDSKKLKQAQIKNIIQIYLNCEEFKFCPDHKRTKSNLEVNIEANFESNKHSLSRSIGKQIKEKFSHKSKSKSNSSYILQNDSQTINWNKFNESNSVFGAKLKVQLPLNYNEMIENYLKDAKLNFEKLENESRQASVEFMSKVNIILANSDDSHFNSKIRNSHSTSPIDLSN